MRIAITADLHWGHHPAGSAATQLLLQHLQEQPPDLLLLGGDIGTHQFFEECLKLFANLPCVKALVPGNHDIWVSSEDDRGNSLQVYEQFLPQLCQQYQYHYLDQGPLVLSGSNLAIVGTINWYDYSWSIERMKAEIPNWHWHLQHKAFSRGRHNDGRFVRWPTDDVAFTQQVVNAFEQHLLQAFAQVERAVVLTHHPAFHGISFPRPSPFQGLDPLLWDALTGNHALEVVLAKHSERIALIFSGHTHRAAEARLGSSRGYNIGGDYHFKRMLMVEWPEGSVETFLFGDPDKRN